jgi:Uma2 family endonuclease
MAPVAVGLAPPDPMHLQGWEEQDEPLATDRHSEEQAYCWTALRYLLEPDGHYVSKDRWLRMDPDDEHDKLLPDLLIARDVLAQQWNVNEYLPWAVGKAPEVLAEFLSPSSEGVDQQEKPERYGKLGVLEYFLFDPDGTYGVPRIQGWALRRDGGREPLARGADSGVASRVLPVAFRSVEGHIAVVDTRTGALALRYEEAQQLLRDEITARFRAEAAQQRAEEAQRQEAQARQRAEQAKQQAEEAQRQEAERRLAAEAEAARLRAEVERLRRDRNGRAS